MIQGIEAKVNPEKETVPKFNHEEKLLIIYNQMMTNTFHLLVHLVILLSVTTIKVIR